MRAVSLIIAATVALSGCSGGSGSNPLGSFPSFGSLNPFGGGKKADVAQAVEIEDPRPLVAALKSVEPESALRGLIIKATAVTPSQGYYDAALVPVAEGTPDENGIVTYEFRASPPQTPQGSGPEQTRLLLAAAFIEDADLEGIRGIRVISASNSVNLRR